MDIQKLMASSIQIEQYACKSCMYTADSQSSLERHERITHQTCKKDYGQAKMLYESKLPSGSADPMQTAGDEDSNRNDAARVITIPNIPAGLTMIPGTSR